MTRPPNELQRLARNAADRKPVYIKDSNRLGRLPRVQDVEHELDKEKERRRCE